MFHQFFIPNQINNNFARFRNNQHFLLAYKFDCQHFGVYFCLVEQDGGWVVVDGQQTECAVIELEDGVVAAVDLGEPLGTAAAYYLDWGGQEEASSCLYLHLVIDDWVVQNCQFVALGHEKQFIAEDCHFFGWFGVEEQFFVGGGVEE